MAKGANVRLADLSENAGSVMIGLGWKSPAGDGDADVSVLLLNGSGKVRSDADFCFYNNPVAAEGSVQLLGKAPIEGGDEDRIGFDLTAVPPDVERIVVAASRDAGSCFGDLDDLRLTLRDGSGETLLGFAIDDADEVGALLFGELYRRADDWRFRAIGQGYASGLAGLATDFGVDIDDDADAADEPGPGTGPGAAPDESGTEAEAEAGVGTGAGAGGEAPASPAGPPAAVAAPAPSAVAVPAPGAAAPSATAPHPGPHTPVSSGPPAPAPSVAAIPAPREAPDAAPAPGTPEPGAADGPHAPGVAAQPPVPARQVARPRTARKKITLPRTLKKSLAENESWRPARLFPVSTLKSDRERETRATSVLLSVMAQVPEFGRRLSAGFGAPAGRMETFTEVTLPHGDTPRRPDGVLRVERAGKLWTALVETKTNGNPLRRDQVQAYLDIAARRGYEAVITLSNDVALDGAPLVDVKTDGRRKNKVSLWHLSWAEVTHQAQTLIRHEGVGSPAHAWLLGELLHYLQHDSSGCHGFQNMGPSWVPVRNGIDDETLCPGDPRAADVVESWERLIRQVCLRLGGELGRKVLPVQRARRGVAPQERRAAVADAFCVDGRLEAELRVEGGPGVLGLVADLRTGKLRTSIDVPAPAQGYPLSWAKRLLRQLAEAPADLHVETLIEGAEGRGPRSTLERLRPEPADMLPRGGERIAGFRLSLFKGMGSGRGSAEAGFIRSVDHAVDRFFAGVVTHLEPAAPRR
ncbi:TerD family protein [Streptomyces sp. NPDC050560]|uniref:TerD family protein n=1 Tax=Streptomyces sp. NPDC050560 TaxID=3365630 RepID=UPI0037BC9F19